MSAAASSLNAKAQPFHSNQSPKDPDAEQQDASDRRVTPIPIENSTLERNHEVLNRLRAEILAGRHPLYKAPADIAKGISELPERYQQGLQLPAPNEAHTSNEKMAENATPLSARIEPAVQESNSSSVSVSQGAKSSPVVAKRTLAAHLNDDPPNEATGQDTPSAAKKVRTQNDETPPRRNGQPANKTQNSPTFASASARDTLASREDQTSVTTSAPSSATKDSSALSLADRLAPPNSTSDGLQRSTSVDKYSGQRLPPASQEERDRMRELRDRLLKERGAISRDKLEEAKNKNIDRYIPDRSERSDRSKPDYPNKAEKTSLRDRVNSGPYDRVPQARMEVDRPPLSASAGRNPGPSDVRMSNPHKPIPPRNSRDEDRSLSSYAQERSGRHDPAYREPSRLVDTGRNGLHSGRLDDRRGPTTAPLPMSHRDTDRDLRYQGAQPHVEYDQRRRSDLESSQRHYDRPEVPNAYGQIDRKHFDERDRDRRLAEMDASWSRPADIPGARSGHNHRDLPNTQSDRSDRYDTRDLRGIRDSIPPYQREADYPPRSQPPASAPLPFYSERSDNQQRLAQNMNAQGDNASRRPYASSMAGRPPSPPLRPPQDRMYGAEITQERRHSDTRHARPIEYPGREEPRPRRDAGAPLGYPPAPLPSANERYDTGLDRSRTGRPYDEPLLRDVRNDSSIRDAAAHRDARDIRDARDLYGPQPLDGREYDRRGVPRIDQPVHVGLPPRSFEERPKDRRSDDPPRHLPEKLSASTSGPKGKPALGPVDSYRPGAKPHSPPPTRAESRELPPLREVRDTRPFDVPPPSFPPRGAPADPRDIRAYPPAPYGAPVYDDRGYPPAPLDSRMPPRGPPAPYAAPYDQRDGYRGPPPPAPAYPYPSEHYQSGRTSPYRGSVPVPDRRFDDRYPPAIPEGPAPRPYYDAYDARPVVPAPYDGRDRGPYTAPPQPPGYPPAPARNDDYRRPDARFDEYRRPDERRR